MGWWGAGSSENKANLAQLVLELGLSLVQYISRGIFLEFLYNGLDPDRRKLYKDQ